MLFFTRKKEEQLRAEWKSYALDAANIVNKEVEKVRAEIKSLQEYEKKAFEGVKDYIEQKTDRNNEFAAFKNEIEARLLAFHKEITDKYFSSLEKIFRHYREISLIDSMAARMNGDKDLGKLKATLMKPYLQTIYKDAEDKQAGEINENIKTTGHKLLEQRSILHEEMIKKERKGLPGVDVLKGKITVLDYIIGGLKDEKKIIPTAPAA